MMRATTKNPLHCDKSAKADRFSPNALALNMFQNCNKTKKLKNHDRSWADNPACAWKWNNKPINIRTNNRPMPKMR